MALAEITVELIGARDDISWWQMSLRAILIVLYGLVLVRFAGKRMFGRWGAIDTVLAVIVGSNLSRALTGGAPFVETLLASTVIIGLHRLLIAVAFRFPMLGPIIKGRPDRLIGPEGVDPVALKRCGVGENDLQEGVRRGGLASLAEVEEAWVERNGDISIIGKAR